jgi:hypothetical protein
LPATFPVLKEGSNVIQIKPGIMVNGIVGTRAYYPFYQPCEINSNLVKGQTDTIYPSVSYYAGKIQWIEDFETGGVTLARFGSSDTVIQKVATSGIVFEGNYSGAIYLDNVKDYFLAVSNVDYNFPKGNSPVFLEMNYKTNINLQIGVYANNTKVEIISLHPIDYWNKIYINLTPTINEYSNVSSFKVYFEVAKGTDIAASETFLDNIKLLYNK